MAIRVSSGCRVGRWVGRQVGRRVGRQVGRQGGRQGGSLATHPGTDTQTDSGNPFYQPPHTLCTQGLKYPARDPPPPHSDTYNIYIYTHNSISYFHARTMYLYITFAF